MRARDHVIASAGVSLGLYAFTYSVPATAVCFLSGVLIDLDHYIEFYFHRKRMPFTYKELYDFCSPFKERKIYLIFHAFEYLLILWLLIDALDLNIVWVGFAIGLTGHLILDQIANPIYPFSYFLTYRFQHQFETIKIITINKR